MACALQITKNRATRDRPRPNSLQPQNHEGFYSVWPGIIRDPPTPARVRDLGPGLPFSDKDATKITYDL